MGADRARRRARRRGRGDRARLRAGRDRAVGVRMAAAGRERRARDRRRQPLRRGRRGEGRAAPDRPGGRAAPARADGARPRRAERRGGGPGARRPCARRRSARPISCRRCGRRCGPAARSARSARPFARNGACTTRFDPGPRGTRQASANVAVHRGGFNVTRRARRRSRSSRALSRCSSFRAGGGAEAAEAEACEARQPKPKPKPLTRAEAREGQAHRRHLRGEPQLRQPLRRLGGRERARERRRRRTRRRSIRPARRTPASCRTTSNLTSPPQPADVHRHDDRHVVHEPLPNAPFTIDDYIKPTRHDVPADRTRRSRSPNGFTKGTGLAGRLHPRHRARVLPGAVPAQRRRAEPLRHRQRRRRADDGLLRHEGAADLRVPARAGASAAT